MARVLLVEDNDADVALLRLVFEEQGVLDIDVAGDHDVALAYLAAVADGDRDRPQVVVLDLNLPLGDGHNVLAAIRADERLSAMRVVVYSTSACPTEIERSHALGAEHVVKPSDIAIVDEFAQRVCGYLSAAAGDHAPIAPSSPSADGRALEAHQALARCRDELSEIAVAAVRLAVRARAGNEAVREAEYQLRVSRAIIMHRRLAHRPMESP